jgi:DMSO/TMAO reductase YedYZ molybdopterin-dependent catalytic subunit
MTADRDIAPTGRPATVRRFRSKNLLAVTTGVVTGLVTFAAATLLSLLFGAESPFLAVGSLAIDFAPPGFKALVISLFGTGDKTFLFALLATLVLIASALVGILEARKPPFGTVLLAFIGFVAAAATISRAGASPLDALPTVLGVIVGWLVLRALVQRLERWWTIEEKIEPPTREAISRSHAVQLERRGFLRLAIVAGAASLLVAVGSGLSTVASNTAAVVRAKIKLPKPVSPAPPIPAAADLEIPGLSPYIVPASEFYRIDTALQVPTIDPDAWKLKITGMVENEVELTFAELLKLPLKERIITLTCVSQEVGGNLIGNASWLGYPIRELLAKAKPKAGADMVLSTSIDGFTASSPLAVLEDVNTDALLAVGMNGEPLPPEHGFPVRMVVPGLYGYVSATKWVVELKVTTYAKDQGYWTPRGYSAKAPVKLSSRIDTPQDGRQVKAGTVAVAGVAWHQHVGIAKVEVQIDNGPWRTANLARVVTVDSWLQWSYAWEAKKGSHTITVRATDDKGEVQTSREVDVVPNGATGLHTIQVQVA